jgi:hypothetical protein
MTINERGSAAQSTFFAASLLVGKDPNKVKGSQVRNPVSPTGETGAPELNNPSSGALSCQALGSA